MRHKIITCESFYNHILKYSELYFMPIFEGIDVFSFFFLSSGIVGTFFPSCWKAYTEYKEGNHMK